VGIDFVCPSLWDVSNCEVFLLPGLNAELDSFQIGPMGITKLSFHDFSAIEGSQYLDDFDVGGVFVRNENLPYFAVFTGEPVDDKLIEPRSKERQRQVRRFARACWLYGSDILYDPTEHIRYRRQDDVVLRRPGICGRNRIGDYLEHRLRVSEISAIAEIFTGLETFDRCRQIDQVRLSELFYSKTFRDSSNESTYRCLLLLSSLTLLIGDNFRIIEGIRDAAPLKSLDLDRIVASRNFIAHGAKTPDKALSLELVALVRMLLNHSITWSLVEAHLSTFKGSELMNRVIAQQNQYLHWSVCAGGTCPQYKGSVDPEEELQSELSRAAQAFESAAELVLKKFVPGDPDDANDNFGSIPLITPKGYRRAVRTLGKISSLLHKHQWVTADRKITKFINKISEVKNIVPEWEDPAVNYLLFIAHRLRGDSLSKRNENVKAVKDFELAGKAFEKLPKEMQMESRLLYVRYLCGYAISLSKVPQWQDAVDKAEQAKRILEKTDYIEQARYSETIEFLSERVGVLNCLAIRQSEANLLNEALNTALQSFRIARDLFSTAPGFLADYRMALNTLGLRYGKLGDHRREEFLVREASRKKPKIIDDDMLDSSLEQT
jgi:tetratricopeptide (TPR) repeat protein